MGIRHDSGGIEGLPLKMVIVLVVTALTVPAVLGSFRAYDMQRAEASVLREIDDVSYAARAVYTSGPGNSITVEFDPDSGTLSCIESVTFGDTCGGDMASVIRYKMQGRGEKAVPVMSPNVPMSGSEGEPLRIADGKYMIKVECVVSDADIDCDGLGPDAHVCLSLIPCLCRRSPSCRGIF